MIFFCIFCFCNILDAFQKGGNVIKLALCAQRELLSFGLVVRKKFSKCLSIAYDV
jgi:hypothetical protein